jgi:hypothetical protein
MFNNYRMPEQCCANCQYSYLNSYGDAQCKKLPPGNLITGGAICDLWIEDTGKQVPQEPMKVEITPAYVEELLCSNCIYLNDTICMMKGKPAEKRCKQYETPSSMGSMIMEGPIPPVEELQVEVLGTCKYCKHSYNGVVPWCRVHDYEITAEGYCNEFEDDEEVISE